LSRDPELSNPKRKRRKGSGCWRRQHPSPICAGPEEKKKKKEKKGTDWRFHFVFDLRQAAVGKGERGGEGRGIAGEMLICDLNYARVPVLGKRKG